MSLITLGLTTDFHSEGGVDTTRAIVAGDRFWFDQIERARANFVALDNLAGIYCAKTILTDAQIKALPTTAVTLIAAPAAGSAIVPLFGVLKADTAAGAYTNIDAAGELDINFGGAGQGLGYVVNDAAITTGSATRLSDLLGTTTNKRATLLPETDTEGVNGWGVTPFILSAVDVEAKALAVSIGNGASGNLTGGNSANTLTIWVVYMVP